VVALVVVATVVGMVVVALVVVATVVGMVVVALVVIHRFPTTSEQL